MLRTRLIRPGIVTNETLAALGAEATLLFERLWMLADRDGKLEDRPVRIRAEAFPYWPEFPVEKLLKNLADAGFILRYKVRSAAQSRDNGVQQRDTALILIANFTKHQTTHAHEAKSVLPSPFVSSGRRRTSHKPNVSTCSDMSGNVDTCSVMSGSPGECPAISIVITNALSGGVEGTGSVVENAPPLEEGKPARKQPARETKDAPPLKVDTSSRSPEEVSLLRHSLENLAREVHMPPPDSDIVARAFAASRGAPASAIHETLVMLFKRQKFRAMRSWGFVPLVLADCFANYREAG